MVKKTIVICLILFFVFTMPAWSEVFLNRIETSLLNEYLSPNDTYGEWYALNATYYRDAAPTWNYHIGATGHYREDGALLLFAGIAKNWSRKLFSNFAVSTSTECDYLPVFRLDADINVKLFKNEILIATLGYAYVNYHTDYEDIIWRYGASLYIQRLVFELMVLDNTSNPKNVKSSTTLLSIGYGLEGWQWTYLVINFGQQAYYVNYEIIQNSNEFTLKHRRWLKKDFGLFASLGYMELGTSYEKYLFQLGFFWQY